MYDEESGHIEKTESPLSQGVNIPPTPPMNHKKESKAGFVAVVIALFVVIACMGFMFMSAQRQMDDKINEIMSELSKETLPPAIADSNNEVTSSEPELNINYSDTASKVYEDNVDAIVQIFANVQQESFWGVVEGTSSGTGFIVDSDGYILTNYHVISDSRDVSLTLHDGTSYDAEILGYNQDHDIAVLKIEATNLPVVTLGKSSDIKVGEEVVTIGHPLSMPYSMSGGMISATNRLISDSSGNPIYVLQTDCSLNEGNSGGPVFNMNGEVIGIANAKLAGTDVEGMGFAVPIDNAIKDYEQIKETGMISGRAQLGVTVVSVTDDIASAFNMKVGVYVNDVASGSAADKAGIKAGDIIIQVGDTAISSSYELQAILLQYSAGDETTITLWNNGKERTVNVNLDEKTDSNTSEDTIDPIETEVEADDETIDPDFSQDQDPRSFTPPAKGFSFPFGK